MATKRLARTLVEPGNSDIYRSDRRWTNRQLRSASRRFSRDARLDAEHADHAVTPQRIPRHSRNECRFCGMHAPCDWSNHTIAVRVFDRWLCAQIGKPWDRVRAHCRHLLPGFRSVLGLGRAIHDLDQHTDWCVGDHRALFVDDHRILRIKIYNRSGTGF